MSEVNDILEIAKLVQFNTKSEAQAVEDYTELLRYAENCQIDDADKKYIASVIEELIADELNHQTRLQMLYTALTEIKAKKD